MRKIQINLGNKTFYTIVVLAIILIVAGIAIALNSGNYAVHGHTADEIQGEVGGGSLVCTQYEGVNASTTSADDFCASKGEVCVTVNDAGGNDFRCYDTQSYVKYIRCCKVI